MNEKTKNYRFYKAFCVSVKHKYTPDDISGRNGGSLIQGPAYWCMVCEHTYCYVCLNDGFSCDHDGFFVDVLPGIDNWNGNIEKLTHLKYLFESGKPAQLNRNGKTSAEIKGSSLLVHEIPKLGENNYSVLTNLHWGDKPSKTGNVVPDGYERHKK